ncbi:MAG: S-layer homology domain-containing protein [Oscillospiraceae bacterium]|nr:S-layer homology domain-containing protein [Oscillospiraceae bacterium]
MKKTVRSLVTVLLIAALLLGVLPLVSAAEPAKETYNDLQTAVCETALAYLHRGHSVQYDSIAITEQGKYLGDGGDIRETDWTSPEDATPDNVMFSVCSAYCFETYYDAFGYQMLGDPLSCKTNNLCNIPADDPICVVKYDATGKDTSSKVIPDRDQALKAAQAALQPGDWVVAHLGESGHAMLYIGTYASEKPSVIHCAGKKYSVDTGIDMVEGGAGAIHNGGAIRIDPIDTFLFADNPGYAMNKAERIVILRPLNVLKASDLTENAKARMKYKGLDIERSASVSRLGAVEQGADVTVTIALKNWSAEELKGVPVSETIPATGKLKAGSITGGGTESGGTVKWTVNIPAGETVTLTYDVTATGKRGETLYLSEGSVGGIRSNKIPIRIGGKGLTAEQCEKLLKIEDYKKDLQGKGYWNNEFINAAYTVLLGIDPQIPAISAIPKNLYDRSKIEGATTQMYTLKQTIPAEYAKVGQMMIDNYHGGVLVKTGGNGHLRLLDAANQDYLQPGDVVMGGRNVFAGKSSELYTYLYLGDNKVAYLEGDKLKTGNASKALIKLLSYDYFVGLRPMQAYDDLTVEAKAGAKLPFTDVKEADWFYTYVKDLYNDGTVNGMTPTTFVPKGNLTYGQALKLIVCALGHGEQASTGGHWASGYLKFAQDKGWITGNVDLNGNVTRLAFCQIAAKAKNLTEQPASNPFKDTSDTAVLALNKAGVINGMSADTFDPSGLLTRAQISKIIWTLRGV